MVDRPQSRVIVDTVVIIITVADPVGQFKDAIEIGNEAKRFRGFLYFPEGYAHGKETWVCRAVVGDLVTENGAGAASLIN